MIYSTVVIQTTLRLHEEDDADIIALLRETPNMAATIKYLLRREARGGLTEREQLELLRLQAAVTVSERVSDIHTLAGKLEMRGLTVKHLSFDSQREEATT